MSRRLFGNEPSTEPMLIYGQLDREEQNSMRFELEYDTFHS